MIIKRKYLSFFSGQKDLLMSIDELDKHDKILFSTFGFHDSEPPHSIVSRKLGEIKENGFALWGVKADKNRFSDIEKLCSEIEESSQKDVYLLLSFTQSLNQLKCEKKEVCGILDETKECRKCSDKDFWKKELLKNENLFKYCTLNGEKFVLLAHNILVRGSDKQNKALVIEKIYLLEDKLNFDKIKTRFYQTWMGTGFFNQDVNLLERNRDEDLKEMDGEGWGIVLKLKAPDYPDYIVECYN